MQVLCSLCGIASVLLLASSLAIAQAPVVVVDDDGGPGVDYTLLHQATAEAANGSVILVKPGDYAGSQLVDGKSLVITADQEGDVRVEYLFVRHLSASQAVVLRGLRFEGATPSGSSSYLDISVNAGAVVVQSCVLRAGENSYAVNVFQSASVTLVDCDALGGDVDVSATNAALSARYSNVTIYDSRLEGYKGSPGGGKGGHGAVLHGGTLFASGSTFQGAQGDPGSLDPFSPCEPVGPGGHGLMFFETPEVFLLDSVTAPGAGGSAIPPCPTGDPGVPIYGFGTVTTYLGEARTLAPLPPVDLGQTATLSFTGKPDDVVFFALSFAPGYQFLPELFGTLVLAAPIHVASAGILSPAGTLEVPVQVPLLPPPVESLIAYLQGGFLNTSGAFFLGSPTAALALAPQL